MRWPLPVYVLSVTLVGCGGDDSPNGVFQGSGTFDMAIAEVCGTTSCAMVCGLNDCDTGNPVLTDSDAVKVAAILVMDRACSAYPNLTASWSNPATRSSGAASVRLRTLMSSGNCGGEVIAGIPLAVGVQRLTLEARQGSETDTRSVDVDYRP